MSKKYETLAADIIEQVGGKENINTAYHCQTRLRFKLKDESIAHDEVLKNMDGVAGVIRNAGVYQVVIGTHVADVFVEIEKLAGLDQKEAADAPEEKKGALNTASISWPRSSSQLFQPCLVQVWLKPFWLYWLPSMSSPMILRLIFCSTCLRMPSSTSYR